MKNRMREIRTSGSVRGEEGNLLAYSTLGRRAIREALAVKGGCQQFRRFRVCGPQLRKDGIDSSA
jgi:hypothetical protein